jgi:undecaprenyl-diphosphatase
LIPDDTFFYLINNTWHTNFLDSLMPLVSFLGRPEFLCMVGVVFIILKKKGTRKLGISLIIGLAISHVVFSILKIAIARPRPFFVLSHVYLLAPEKGFSFPSGHATNIFMVVALLSSNLKKFRYCYIIAFLVAFSRVYLGVHYPSDVLAGALLGMALGYGLEVVNKKIPFQTKL